MAAKQSEAARPTPASIDELPGVLRDEWGCSPDRSRRTYGSPRIHASTHHADLREAVVRVGRKRVARLMRAHGLQGVHRRSWRHATKTDPAAAPAPDRLDREFTATGPDQKGVTDVTYVPTVQGWLYLAVVLDTYSRRIVGWSMDTSRKTRLVCDAVAMAVANHGGSVTGVIHHSDRGGEYTSRDLEIELRRCGALPRWDRWLTASIASILLSLLRRSDPCYDRPCGCLGVDVSAAVATTFRPLVGRAVT